jgi:excisionase family DNA binding protein
VAKKKRKKRLFELTITQAEKLNTSIPVNGSGETISPNEAGELLGFTGEAVKQWVYSGQLPAVKLSNGYWRIRKVDLQNYVQSKCELRQRLLIAVTSQKHRDLLEAGIRRCGHHPVHASSLLDAMLKASDLKPGMIFVDLNDGFAWNLIRRLKSEPSTSRSTCVVVIAPADLKQEQLTELMQYNVKAALTEPLEENAIAREIAAQLHGPAVGA